MQIQPFHFSDPNTKVCVTQKYKYVFHLNSLLSYDMFSLKSATEDYADHIKVCDAM